MRSKRWTYCVASLAALAFGLGATAQSCYKFTNKVSAYSEVSTDGTNIYASTVLGGTYVMSGSGTCPIPPAGYHYSITYGQLTSASGAHASSSSGGQHVCTSCYISGSNEQELPIDSDDSWTFNWDGEAMCSSAGELLSSGGSTSIVISPAVTVGQQLVCTVTADGDQGTYTPACSSGPPRCPIPIDGLASWKIQFGNTEACWEYARTAWLAVYTNGVLDECVANLVSLQASGPGTCF